MCKCSNGFNGANFQSLRADDQLCANPHHYALSVHRAFTDRIHLPPGFQAMTFHLGAPPKLYVRRRHGVYVFSILDPLNPPTSFNDDDDDEDEAHDDEMMLKGSSILMSMPERRQTPALLHTMSSGSESSNEASSQRSEPPSAFNTLLLAIQLASDTSKQQEVPSSE